VVDRRVATATEGREDLLVAKRQARAREGLDRDVREDAVGSMAGSAPKFDPSRMRANQ
jgi:hypothetical protein